MTIGNILVVIFILVLSYRHGRIHMQVGRTFDHQLDALKSLADRIRELEHRVDVHETRHLKSLQTPAKDPS